MQLRQVEAKISSKKEHLKSCVFRGETDFVYDQIHDLRSCSNHFEREKSACLELFEKRKTLLLHRKLKEAINAEINDLIENLNRLECVIFLDYKENMKLARGPMVLSRD